LAAVLPSSGPCADGVRPCRLHVDHLRERRTGPGHPVTVVRCTEHKRAFTLYPPGHVPYGRAALAAVAPDGGPVQQHEGEVGGSGWRATLFEAAVAAAHGGLWPRECLDGSRHWQATQRREVGRAIRLLGLDPTSHVRMREAMAQALGVDLQLLVDWSHTLCGRPGLRQRGRAVCAVLHAVAAGPCVVDRLAAGGALVGLWGRPLRWDPVAGQLRGPPFPAAGTGVVDRGG